MNDTTNTGKLSFSSSSSSLSITEKKKKKNQRSYGCMNIFCQLFDWNKRLTKKNLFSKKLLTLGHARAKQASSKKFIGDVKIPNSKPNLIANENNGGFPSAENGGNPVIEIEQKHEMRVPGLVARLIGVESFPDSQQDKSNEASFCYTCGVVEKESLGNHSSKADKCGVDSEIGVVEHDLRPHKIQKLGTNERRAVTRFGAEPSQIKSVLSRARKYNQRQHHPKPASPLKSPRISSRKTGPRSSRLIGGVTKILEPGLHASSRAKCSLTSASIHTPKNGIVTERVGTRSAYLEAQSDYDAGIANSSMEHTSCQNCGNLLVDCKPDVKALPHISLPNVSDVFTDSSLVLAPKERSLMPFHEHDIVFLESQEKNLVSVANEEEGKSNVQLCKESMTGRMPIFREGPDKWNSSCQPCIKDEASSFVFKHKTLTSNVNETKDFVALNRSLSGRTRMRSPTEENDSEFVLEGKPCSKPDDSLPWASTLELKRKTRQVEGMPSVNLVAVEPRNLSSDAHRGKMRDFNASSRTSSNVKRKRGVQQKTYKVNDNKVNEVVSFTSNSPFKQMIVLPCGREGTTSDNEMKKYLQGPLPFREDAIGAFLRQKLDELCSQEDGKLDIGYPPKKPTSMILRELISALSSEHLKSPDDHIFEDKYVTSGERLLRSSSFANHLSHESVLQTSFSSSSLDESSGHGSHPDPINCSCDKLGQLELDAELLDSATTFNKGKVGCEILTKLVDQVTTILQSLNFFGTRLTKSKFNHMKDVILNAELVLRNVTEQNEDGVPQLLISCFLRDNLDAMANDATWKDFNAIVDCDDDSKERIQLKAFLLDCVIEYLESNCSQYYDNVFKTFSAWTKLPLCAKAEKLVQEVKREIKKWSWIARMEPYGITEWDMSHSLVKWNDFDIEAFEASIDIDEDLLQTLIDEIVEDLVDSSTAS
ncbi:hypothetical protein TanjilG_05194 [Lupinus angustifolius]|uniref:DUF4378 domain-containing protein n=1 Tax=Lupinus angustifolius TaxID=3871 RepID=A0A4P1RB18_LUPAN|nr:PREDICTED: uncharacterized protein LOC109353745 [Lupinus angustifolius]OIW06423.1 hypothetical protein TanjilG_05194 [Lupinus angustifolius]